MMSTYILLNVNTKQKDEVMLNSPEEAFAMVRERNRKDRSAPWRAFDDCGNLIVGLLQNNESGCFEGVALV